jgi:hypothetical protein
MLDAVKNRKDAYQAFSEALLEAENDIFYGQTPYGSKPSPAAYLATATRQGGGLFTYLANGSHMDSADFRDLFLKFSPENTVIMLKYWKRKFR